MRQARESVRSLGEWVCWLHCARLRLTSALFDESGQDLVEYAIVVALISLAAIAGMRGVATAIGAAFTRNATKFSSYTT